MDMRKKLPVPFERKFPNADPLALRLLQRLLAFDPKDRPTAQEVSFYLAWHILCSSRENLLEAISRYLYIFFFNMNLRDPFFVWLAGTI